MSAKRTSGPRPGAKPQLPAEVQRDFGQRLREARIAADLTLAELADRTGMQPSNISEIENGLRNVTVETMSKLATAVGLEIKILLAPARPRKR
jgi:transcriptional regulator with XRE-family HTH domain